MRQCPKCKTINPPVRSFDHSHSGEQCKQIIGIKKNIFGFTTKLTCDSYNDFDCDDDWIYFRRQNEITKELPKRFGFQY